MAQYILDLLRGYLVHYGYWAVAAALLLENAGLPVPGETILLLASFLAYSEGELHLLYIILIGTTWVLPLATTGGARCSTVISISSVYGVGCSRKGSGSFSDMARQRFSLPDSSLGCESSRGRSPAFCACPGGNLWLLT